MKKKLLMIFEFLFITALLLFTGFIYFDNEKLKDVIDKQNIFLKDVLKNDSTYNATQKKLKDSIDGYTEKLSWILNGSKVSPDIFIDAYKNLEAKNDSLKLLYNHAKEYYGFKMSFKKTEKGDKIESTSSIVLGTRADSARITYNFFKDRIYKKADGWYAEATSKADLQEQAKMYKEIISKLQKQN